MPRANYLLVLIPLVLFGAIGGFFYAYSVSVMQGLNNLPETDAIRAMQELNRGTRNGLFLVTFVFTPIAALLCAAALYFRGQQMSASFLVAAAAVYFAGSFLPTVNINVPLNHAIEALDPGKLSLAEATAVWTDYSRDWTFWNTTRAIMALIGLGLAGTAMHNVRRLEPAVA
ncbi:DUF1772 domain-containing protein [Primorskyibacter aestuariivivens]|uniref:anthrone oxygenase family protein n=1 Tax=Primorskyibacter aestuariivivens TaxID=1888912 RepID=UPI0022FFC885|nr:anthrone oxygenase family protein [Primorskyibacter aestuariivivens]MDA7429479.1 DUF1772 domain-containing protein [Primorskyibacter aestuariivivens]